VALDGPSGGFRILEYGAAGENEGVEYGQGAVPLTSENCLKVLFESNAFCAQFSMHAVNRWPLNLLPGKGSSEYLIPYMLD